MAKATKEQIERLKNMVPPEAETSDDEFTLGTEDAIMEGRAWNEEPGKPVVPKELRHKKPKKKY